MSSRITHVIPVLTPGGAENQLATLAIAQAQCGDHVSILALSSDRLLREELAGQGVVVVDLRTDGPRETLRAATRARRGDIVHSWMYHGHILGAILRPFGSATHVWGVRRTEPFSSGLKRRTRLIARLGRRLAPRAAHALVFCSQTTRDRHVEAGFRAPHLIVTLNAIPTKFLEPWTPAEHSEMRAGCLTRWTTDKGIDVLLDAWMKYIRSGHSGRLTIAGPGIDSDNAELVEMVAARSVSDSVELVGPFREPREFHRSIDVYVSPSRTEGFPNVVAEAMATGLAVVATDVGGTAEVLGDTGILVENEDANGIAEALALLDDDVDLRTRMGAESHERCRREFTIESTRSAVASAYEEAQTKPAEDAERRRPMTAPITQD